MGGKQPGLALVGLLGWAFTAASPAACAVVDVSADAAAAVPEGGPPAEAGGGLGVDATPGEAGSPADTRPAADGGADAGPEAPDGALADGATGDGAAGPACDAPCELVAQCGCGTGERCDLADATGRLACVADGTVEAGGECGPAGSCRAGSLCMVLSPDGRGLCHRYCEASGDCSGGGRCLPVVVGDASGSRVVPGVHTCTTGCTLAPSAGCPAGFGCALFVEDPDAAFPEYYGECAAASSGLAGDACTAETGCSPGYQCLIGTCAKLCRVTMGDLDCGDVRGTGCRGNLESPYLVEGFEYGFCQ